ncbi:MAG: amino acid ABC transporter permease [Clostridiales Family XIII bacterium]|jgi:L-cystine transport system permease protein|nr:amino acid ABC transporter permease [Clostridiales Family XIII bacterium]
MQGISFEKTTEFMAQMLPYLWVTFQYVLLSLFFGGILAFALTLMKLSGSRVLRAIAYAYTTVLRCLPSVTLLFLVYFLLPALFRTYLGINLNGYSVMLFVVVTFSMFLGAFLSEVMRASYLAVSKEQREAALSIGLTGAQTFRRIILPQAFYYSIPNLGNTVIYLMKDGALGFTIGFVDLMGKAYLLNSNTYGTHVMDIYLGVALIYWVSSALIEFGFHRLEKRFSILKSNKKRRFLSCNAEGAVRFES